MYHVLSPRQQKVAKPGAKHEADRCTSCLEQSFAEVQATDTRFTAVGSAAVTVSRKKVIVRRFLPGLVRGYLPPSGFVRNESGRPELELLDLTGRVQMIALDEIKLVSFVREFNMADESAPERLPRKTFLARPRTEGLWLRVSLRDEEQIEGLSGLDLSLADGWMEDAGLQLVPPDIRGNTQRLYIPRSAMSALQVVAVVTTPSRKKVAEAPVRGPEPDLFSLALSQDGRPQ